MRATEIQLLGEIRLRRAEAGEQAVAGAAGGWLGRRGIAKTVIYEAGGRTQGKFFDFLERGEHVLVKLNLDLSNSPYRRAQHLSR